MGTRPAIFKWRQTEPGLILCAVRWYLRYSLSLRDVEELLEERGLNVDHTTVWRWVQYYGPELEQRLRQHLKPTNKSWRVDETYVRVKGRWCYLYRAIDSRGATIDFLLSAFRDADAAKLAGIRHLASEDLAVVFARHHALRSRDKGGEESIELLDVHCLAALATFEEFRETIEFGVGQRLLMGHFCGARMRSICRM